MIEVKNLTFFYGKDKQALHGLDFTVEDGEIFVREGHSLVIV